MRRLAVTLGVVALAVPAPAAARTIELGWREHDGVGVMRFAVSRLHLTNGRWRVDASFTNLSRVRLRVEPPRFALLAYGSPTARDPARTLPAATFSPPLPAGLGPGRTWRGSFAGVGVPRRGAYLRVRLGRFRGRPSPLPEFPNGFSWITDHVHRLR